MTLIDPAGDTHTRDLPSGDHELPLLDTLSRVVEACGTRDDIYLRFCDRSHEPEAAVRERESGYLLPGVPTWPLCPEPWWGAGDRVWIARQLARRSHLGNNGAEPWLVTGEVRGRGPDCEPLIGCVRPVARIDRHVLAEAEEAYAEWQTRAFRSMTG